MAYSVQAAYAQWHNLVWPDILESALKSVWKTDSSVFVLIDGIFLSIVLT